MAQLSPAGKPPPPLLSEQLPHVASPRLRVSLSEVAEVLASVEAAGAAVEAELRLCGPPVSVQLSAAQGDGEVQLGLQLDAYSEVMGAALADVRRQLAEAREQLGAVRENFAALASFFGESAAALGTEQELWGDVQHFVGQFSAAQRALQQARQLEERAEQQRGTASASAAPGSRRKAPAAQGGQSDGEVAVSAVAVANSGLAGLGAKKQLSFSSSAAISSSTASVDGSAAPGRLEDLGGEA